LKVRDFSKEERRISCFLGESGSIGIRVQINWYDQQEMYFLHRDEWEVQWCEEYSKPPKQARMAQFGRKRLKAIARDQREMIKRGLVKE